MKPINTKKLFVLATFILMFVQQQLMAQYPPIIDCPPNNFVITNNNPSCDVTVLVTLYNCDIIPRPCQTYTVILAFGGGSWSVPCFDIFNGCWGAKTCDIEVCISRVQNCNISPPVCVSGLGGINNTVTVPVGCCGITTLGMSWWMPPVGTGGVIIQ